MNHFTTKLPTICEYFRHGKDRLGVVTGSVQGKGGPGVVVETIGGGVLELRYITDAFTIYQPHHDRWPHLANQLAKETNQ